MIEIAGKYNTAICYANEVDPTAISQLIAVCNEKAFKDSKIRVMPDVHAGKGCTIGTTMTITDKVVPNMVGVDIGCGMLTVTLGQIDIDLDKFDAIAHTIPSGRGVWDKSMEKFDLTQLLCCRSLKKPDWLERSLGTLGGGNHFIEIDISDDNTKYLVIHSGSRNLGTQVARIYQQLAISLCSGMEEYLRRRESIIESYKNTPKKSAIQKLLKEADKEWRSKKPALPADLCYLYGSFMDEYMHDVDICQNFAKRNREKMAEILLDKMGITPIDSFHTIHNYIDVEEKILRKGSVSAKNGERLLIPINMRDGSLICIGKGNSEWNFSAPHGAGRLMSRSDALAMLSMDEYAQQMKGIYSTCVNSSTLDESPMAYKSIDEIVENIGPTAEIIERIRPIYNFKAAE